MLKYYEDFPSDIKVFINLRKLATVLPEKRWNVGYIGDKSIEIDIPVGHNTIDRITFCISDQGFYAFLSRGKEDIEVNVARQYNRIVNYINKRIDQYSELLCEIE